MTLTKPTMVDTSAGKFSMERLEEAYILGDPIIDDQEWDMLVAKTDYKEKLSTPSSMKTRTKVPLDAPMVSVKKVYSQDKLKKELDAGKQYMIAPKFDGVPIVVNKQGAFMTRGDGTNGLLLYKKALWGVRINGIGEIPEAWDSVRGELLTTENVPASRSIVAGILNRKNPSHNAAVSNICKNNITDSSQKDYYSFEDKSFHTEEYGVIFDELIFVAYAYTVDGEVFDDPKALTEAGFNSEDILNKFFHASVSGGEIDKIKDIIDEYYAETTELATDGLVFKEVDSSGRYKQVMGGNSHHPETVFAVKFPRKVYETDVLEIVYSKSKAGADTVQANIAPFETSDGRTIKKINLHNPKWLASMPYIKEGAHIGVVMSGDIIAVPVDLEKLKEGVSISDFISGKVKY